MQPAGQNWFEIRSTTGVMLARWHYDLEAGKYVEISGADLGPSWNDAKAKAKQLSQDRARKRGLEVEHG